MPGISIPIGGNTTSLRAALAEVTKAIRELTATMRRDFASVNQSTAAVAAGTRAIGQAGQQAGSRLRAIVTGASAAGAHIANIVAGAQAMRTAFNAIRATTLGTSLIQAMASAGGLRQMISRIGAGMRALLASPTFRKIAIGAIAAGVAIGGMIVAIRVVRTVLNGLTSVARTVFGGIVSAARSAANAIKGIFTGVGGGGGASSMLGPLAGLVAGIGVFALAFGQFKTAMHEAMDFEVLQTRVESFLGSTADAKALLDDLADYANKNPVLGVEGTQQAGATLLGAGVRKNIAEITKDLGAVAKDGQQLKELADALAKGFAKQKFQTEELNKFLDRGINLLPELQRVTGLAGDELSKAVEKGLSFDDVTEAIRRMSREGGQMFGVSERLGSTTAGLVARLADGWQFLRKEFAKPIVDALKPMLVDANKFVDSLATKAREMGQSVADAMYVVMAAVKGGKTGEVFEKGFSLAVQAAIDVLMRGLRGAVAFLATAMPPIFDAAFAKLKDPMFWEGVANLLKSVGTSIAAEIRSAIPGANDDLVKSLKAQAQSESFLGKKQLDEAGTVEFGKVLMDALAKGGKAAMEAMGGDASRGLQDARRAWQELSDSLIEDIQRMKKDVAVPPPAKDATGSGLGAIGAAVGKAMNAITIASSLARVGGAKGVMIYQPMVAQQQKTNQQLGKSNQLLGEIAGTLKGGLTATYA